MKLDLADSSDPFRSRLFTAGPGSPKRSYFFYHDQSPLSRDWEFGLGRADSLVVASPPLNVLHVACDCSGGWPARGQPDPGLHLRMSRDGLCAQIIQNLEIKESGPRVY